MVNERRVLVTGANGFIGSHLVERLLSRGETVRALLRPSGDTSFLHPDVERVHGDVTIPASLPPALEGVGVVYHVAGALSSHRVRTLYEVNGTGTGSLVKACAKAAPDLSRFVLVSSLAAGGPSRAGRPRREADPPRPVSHYGASKLLGERAAAAVERGFPLTIVRPPVVYGPRDRGALAMFQLARRGLVPSFRREKYYSVCHVDDLTGGILAAAAADGTGDRTYHLADSKAYALSHFFAVAGEALGVPQRRLPVPGGILPLVGALADAVGPALGLRGRPVRDKIREFVPDYWVADSTRARRELRFRTATAFEDGVRGTLEFYRAEGWLA